MAKKITVIGGSGFVGTNLCRQLELKQQDFEIIDLKMSNQFPEKCKIADVRDAESLRNTITGDVVVNLAAVHRDDVRDKSEYQRTNVDGAQNVALVCEEKGINKIVFTSTLLFMDLRSLVLMRVAKSIHLMNMGGLSLKQKKNYARGTLKVIIR